MSPKTNKQICPSCGYGPITFKKYEDSSPRIPLKTCPSVQSKGISRTI